MSFISQPFGRRGARHCGSLAAIIGLLATTAVATSCANAQDVATGPVSVKIDAPATAIAGEKLYLTLQETGAVRNRVWSVLPAGSVGFDPRDKGAHADFATRFAGTYVFVVSVAGADGSVAHAFHTLELRDDDAHNSLSPAHLTPAIPSPANMPTAAAKAGSDVPALILAWASQTPSTNRRAEAALIAGQLNALATAIDAGTNASADLMAETRGTCAVALGSRYAAWSPFFDSLGQLFADMQRRGAMPGRDNFSAALRSTAKVLERL